VSGRPSVPSSDASLARLAEALRAEQTVISSHVAEPEAEEPLGRLAAAGPRAAADPGEYALVVETVYEGYLLHYGSSRLFAPEDGDTALLLGDYLYAHGLVRIEEAGTVAAVNDLAELIALCAYLQAEEIHGDGAAWAATATSLGLGALDDGRSSLRLDNDPSPMERLARSKAGDEQVDAALAAHRALLR